jgi:NADH-quinone oxidoreductase subunit I
MLPKIVVDDSKCTNPLSCRKCLLICPMHVLGLGTKVGPKKFQEIPPEQFRVAGVRLEKCTACLDCVRACPHGAIQVSYDGGAAK